MVCGMSKVHKTGLPFQVKDGTITFLIETKKSFGHLFVNWMEYMFWWWKNSDFSNECKVLIRVANILQIHHTIHTYCLLNQEITKNLF